MNSSFPVYATSPLPWAVLLLVVLALSWRYLPRGVAVIGVVIEVLLCFAMTPLGAYLLERAAVARVPPAGACAAPTPTTVVVLGGGYHRPPRDPRDYGALRSAGLERVFAAVALWRDIPGARLVVAGGAGTSIPEAIPMANLAVALGVPAAVIEIDGRSRNTWQNASNVAALASPPVARRIWLVTSPMHLPRALDAFRAWGFDPCAWPAGPVRTGLWSGPGMFIPHATSAREAGYALHELIGSVEYTVLAWRHARNARRDQTP